MAPLRGIQWATLAAMISAARLATGLRASAVNGKTAGPARLALRAALYAPLRLSRTPARRLSMGESAGSSAGATAAAAFITTPIYYVNDKPHIGHAYTTVACDMMARFNRLDGRRTRLVTGTDEHGQKVQQSAEKKDMAPLAFCDSVSATFRRLADTLKCTYDDFIRTTEPRHRDTVTQLWRALQAKGYIYKSAYAGWYSVRDEAFYSESELVDGKAPTGAEVQWVEEPSYFFRLSALQEPLLALLRDRPGFVLPTARRNEMLRFVEGGLQDLSISRTAFSWGIPVPDDEEHVIYVWLDALTNYLTACGYDVTDLEALRKGSAAGGPAAVWPPTVHVVGKDILRFHTVFWPAFLLAADLPLPDRVFAHGWWTIEGQKMSKSLGNVVDPFDLVARFGLDATRYFLLCGVPFGGDGDYSEEALVSLCNAHLANQLGNLLHRTLTLVHKHCGGVAPSPETAEADDDELLAAVYALLPRCRAHVAEQAVHRVGDDIAAAVRLCNEYIDMQAPWSLRKTNPERMAAVLWTLLEAMRCVGILMQPLTPIASSKMLDQLGVPPCAASEAGSGVCASEDARSFAAVCRARALTPGTPVLRAEPVFPRIVLEEVPSSSEEAGGAGGASRPPDDLWLEAVVDIEAAVKEQGDRVRALKAAKADRSAIAAEVEKLLKLKSRLPAST